MVQDSTKYEQYVAFMQFLGFASRLGEGKPGIKSYVVGLAFNPEGTHVALIKKNKPAWQFGYLNGIGGSIEAGETPSQAMVREFQEETGYTTQIEDWKQFAVTPGFTWEVYWFKATIPDLSNLKTTTSEQVMIVPLEKKYDDVKCLSEYDVIQNLKWLIPMALDTNPICAVIDYRTNF